MKPFYLTPEYQVYDTAKQILEKFGGTTLSGTKYADEYRKLDILSFEERNSIAALIEINFLCVGYDKDGEIEIIKK